MACFFQVYDLCIAVIGIDFKVLCSLLEGVVVSLFGVEEGGMQCHFVCQCKIVVHHTLNGFPFLLYCLHQAEKGVLRVNKVFHPSSITPLTWGLISLS